MCPRLTCAKPSSSQRNHLCIDRASAACDVLHCVKFIIWVLAIKERGCEPAFAGDRWRKHSPARARPPQLHRACGQQASAYKKRE